MIRALALLLLFPLAALAQEPVAAPVVQAGDSWTYRAANILGPGAHEFELRVTRVNESGVHAIAVRKSDAMQFESLWTPEWNAMLSYTGRIARPHGGTFRFPMRVGDKYEARYEGEDIRSGGPVTQNVVQVAIAGWEDVEVPAGKFRALRIDFDGKLMGAGFQLGFKGSSWYVPEVKRWAKLSYLLSNGTRLEETLLSYKLLQSK